MMAWSMGVSYKCTILWFETCEDICDAHTQGACRVYAMMVDCEDIVVVKEGIGEER